MPADRHTDYCHVWTGMCSCLPLITELGHYIAHNLDHKLMEELQTSDTPSHSCFPQLPFACIHSYAPDIRVVTRSQ